VLVYYPKQSTTTAGCFILVSATRKVVETNWFLQNGKNVIDDSPSHNVVEFPMYTIKNHVLHSLCSDISYHLDRETPGYWRNGIFGDHSDSG